MDPMDQNFIENLMWVQVNIYFCGSYFPSALNLPNFESISIEGVLRKLEKKKVFPLGPCHLFRLFILFDSQQTTKKKRKKEKEKEKVKFY